MTPAAQLAENAENGGLKVIAAAGPFTFSDDLSFQVSGFGAIQEALFVYASELVGYVPVRPRLADVCRRLHQSCVAHAL